MDYNFYSFNNRGFEHLIQSLSRKILGNGLISFGDGPDGGREGTFDGKAPFPSETECWDGYWIIQAKFKTRAENDDNEKNYSWVKNEFQEEMKKFKSRKGRSSYPDNYLFFTNVVLTPKAETGGRDKINALAGQYRGQIKNIKILGYDDLRGFLDNNRDVATAFSSFILPGDILHKLYELLKSWGEREKKLHGLLGRFLEAEFREDMQSRLDHAGKLTDDKVHLEKVFVDLFATNDGIAPTDDEQKKFLGTCLEAGNSILRPAVRSLRYVLIGGPGYGKSTLTQFLCQVYRAYFLKNRDASPSPLPEIGGFIADFNEIKLPEPACYRFPFKISLKDFAGWLAEQKTRDEIHSIMKFLKYRIEKRGSGAAIEIEDIEELLKALSFVFIFDGLDEVPATANRADVLTEITNFIEIDLRRCDCDALIIATTRPQGYTSDFDRSRYTHLILADLTTGDCEIYLERLLNAIVPGADEREKHLEILKRSLGDAVISSLMKTPLQASIMAILVKSGGEPPRYKYDLFSEYYNIIFKRERQKNICKILNENPKYIDHIHYKMGFWLQLSAEKSDKPSSNISKADFKNIVSAYLVSQGLPKEEAESKAVQILQAAVERLVFLEEVMDGRIGFSIRSLQEYFAANYYVINQPDEIIVKRLRYMCGSAYWRNTMLFALGYLCKHKDYIIDHVESICRELNGSANEPGKTSGTQVSKLGSWLALDILVEGIFRGHPLFENKFAGFLEDLFTISPSYKHSSFGNLSDGIKSKWILPLIDTYTSSGVYEDELTGWTIGIYLLKHGFAQVKEVFDNNWPTGAEEVKLLKHFKKLKVKEDEWFIEKFLSALKRNTCFTFIHELFDSEFIYNLAISPANDYASRKILMQNLFMRIISFPLGLDIIEKVIENIFEFKRDEVVRDFSRSFLVTFLYGERDQIEIDLLGDGKFKIEAFPVMAKNKNIEKFIALFSKYKINYLEQLMIFLCNPDRSGLKKFFEALQEEPAEVFEIVKKRFVKVNWLLAKISYEAESLDEIISGIEDNRWGDRDDWLEFEKKIVKEEKVYERIDFIKYCSIRIWRVVGSKAIFKSFVNDYYLRFKDDPQLRAKNVLCRELLNILIDFLLNESTVLRKYLDENRSIIDELFSILKDVNVDELGGWFFNFIFYNLLYFFSEQEIMVIAAREGQLLEKFDLARYGGPIDKEEKSDIFKKLEKILNRELLDNRESALIKLPVWVLFNNDFSSTPSLEINFNDLHKASHKSPDNEACRILLCLFDPGMDRSKAEKLAAQAKLSAPAMPRLPGHIIRMIEKFGFKGDWVESFLLEVYNLVDRHDHDVKTKYENYFKDMLESRPSHLHEDSVQQELKL